MSQDTFNVIVVVFATTAAVTLPAIILFREARMSIGAFMDKLSSVYENLNNERARRINVESTVATIHNENFELREEIRNRKKAMVFARDFMAKNLDLAEDVDPEQLIAKVFEGEFFEGSISDLYLYKDW